jgi:hypothetical protein
MKRFRTTARVAGILFLISDVTSIIGLALYQPLLKHTDFATSTGANTNSILAGAFMEILLAISVAGTAIALYPVLKKQNESLALGYVIGRAAEATIITVGILSLLTVLTLRSGYLVNVAADTGTYITITSALVALHDWTFLFGPNIILAINATILGYVLYKSKLVPRAIALLALIDGPILFLSGISVLFGAYSQTSPFAALLALPMLAFEVSFALYLILRGFKSQALTALEAKK